MIQTKFYEINLNKYPNANPGMFRCSYFAKINGQLIDNKQIYLEKKKQHGKGKLSNFSNWLTDELTTDMIAI